MCVFMPDLKQRRLKGERLELLLDTIHPTIHMHFLYDTALYLGRFHLRKNKSVSQFAMEGFWACKMLCTM